MNRTTTIIEAGASRLDILGWAEEFAFVLGIDGKGGDYYRGACITISAFHWRLFVCCVNVAYRACLRVNGRGALQGEDVQNMMGSGG